MKTVQKLEIFAGIATFLLILPNLWLTDNTFQKFIQESRNLTDEVFVSTFIFLILPASLIAIGAYFHATKNSILGIVILIVCGGFFIFGYGVAWLIGSAFNGYRLLGLLPGFFAFITVFLAIYNSITTYRNKSLS